MQLAKIVWKKDFQTVTLPPVKLMNKNKRTSWGKKK